MKVKKRWIILGGILVLLGLLSIPEMTHVNTGTSVSRGSVRDGKLENGWLIPFKGDNHRYFSYFSYYILNNAYVHSSVYHTIMDTYATCEGTCPDRQFVLMECSGKHGGQMLVHWTHQNGLSVDFMVPKKNDNSKTILSNYMGMPHYLLQFNGDGRLSFNRKTVIDFEAMAHHILALDDAAQKNGLRIRKILFHTDMHDNLFSSAPGQILQQRDIRFISRLDDLVNRFHDDHYHVDFEMREE